MGDMIEPAVWRDTGLPLLAYYVRSNAERVEVVHGRNVYVDGAKLHDGVWAGPVDETWEESTYQCGTGVLFGPRGNIPLGGVDLYTSDTSRDRLFICRLDDEVVVANSLPVLLNILDDDLDPFDTSYRGMFQSIERSLYRSPRTFSTLRKRKVRILSGEVASLRGTAVSISRRPRASAFGSFADYEERLTAVAEAIIANARDERRGFPFDPLVTMSVGYDSTAVAAVVSKAGVSEGVTLLRRDARGEFVDHPGAIAEALGIDLVEVERGKWLDGTGEPEAAIAAAGVTLMDTVFLGLEDQLAGRLVFTGASGDAMWGRSLFRSVDGDVVVPSGALGGRGLSEHRLGLGYGMCALPDFGHTAHRSMVAISRAETMQPWSVGGDYDRPVARRLAEEAGVPREFFGNRKLTANAGVGVSNHRYVELDRAQRERELSQVMSSAATRSFLDFVEQHETPRVRRRLKALRIMFAADQSIQKFDVKVFGRLSDFGVHRSVPRSLTSRMGRWGKVYPDYSLWLIHWGTSCMKKLLNEDAGLGAEGRAMDAEHQDEPPSEGRSKDAGPDACGPTA